MKDLGVRIINVNDPMQVMFEKWSNLVDNSSLGIHDPAAKAIADCVEILKNTPTYE
jgi:hypothetical protein